MIAGIPLFLVAGRFSWSVQLALAIILTAIGWYVSEKAAKELGRADPQEIVIDELCGFMAAMIGHTVGFASIVTGFVLFRLFDIWKPWPIRLIDRNLSGGIGIMADDILAGIYANFLGIVTLKLLLLVASS